MPSASVYIFRRIWCNIVPHTLSLRQLRRVHDHVSYAATIIPAAAARRDRRGALGTSVIRPVKTVGRITYIVLVQTLNHAQSLLNQPCYLSLCPSARLSQSDTRKLCYRKDDRAMRAI